MKQLCIAVSDPNQLFREGLQHLLRRSQFTVTASAKTIADVVIQSADGKVDLVICGLEAEEDLDAHFAELARWRAEATDVRFVMLVHAPDRKLLWQAVNAGVDAVLSKDISGEVLQRSLELVMLGQQLFPALALAPAASQTSGLIPFPRTAIPPSPASVQAEPPARLVFSVDDRQHDVLLSEREAQILQCLIGGASNKLIARDLSITEATVKVHIKGLLRKVRVNNRTQAAIWGVNNGIGSEGRRAVPDNLVLGAASVRHGAS